MGFIWEKITEALQYSEKAPMLFNSGLFLTFFIIFITIYAFIYNHQKARIWYVTAFSLYFYYKSSGWYLLILIFCICFNYYAALKMASLQDHNQTKKGKGWLISAILVNISFLIYFKYTNFLFANIYHLLRADFTKMDIFLPIGISFFTFQTISYIVDVYRGTIKPAKNLMDFAFYLSYFPQLVAGPIVRAQDFLPQIHQKIIFNKKDMGDGLFMVFKGLIKKAVIADYMAQYVDIVYANPQGYSGFENLMAMYAYTLQIYCDFSGYSDMAIGIALIMGFRLMDNFRSPYNSLDITEFWRRWHISLSTWLRDYIYIPLGGNRFGEEKQFLFLMLTMLIGGLWHGADWKFVFWGGMHGLGLIVHKIFSQTVKEMEWNQEILKPLGWIITFHFVAFLWIFFRAQSFEIAATSIHKIIFSLDFAYLYPFFKARTLLFYLLVLGFAIHFISQKDKERMSVYFGI